MDIKSGWYQRSEAGSRFTTTILEEDALGGTAIEVSKVTIISEQINVPALTKTRRKTEAETELHIKQWQHQQQRIVGGFRGNKKSTTQREKTTHGVPTFHGRNVCSIDTSV